MKINYDQQECALYMIESELTLLSVTRLIYIYIFFGTSLKEHAIM